MSHSTGHRARAVWEDVVDSLKKKKQKTKLIFFVSGTLKLQGCPLADSAVASAFSPYLMGFLQGDLVGVERVFKLKT